jgi:arylsulfatase A-like enzyme
VREFQSGAESPWTERAEAIIQRATIDGLGFGCLALLLAGTAFVLTRGKEESGASRRVFANALIAGAAFWLWIASTWVTDAALPFLGASELLLMNVMGLVAAGVACTAWVAISARLPWANKADPVAYAFGSLISFGVVFYSVQETALNAGNPRSFITLASIAAILIAGLLLSAVAGRLFASVLLPIERVIGQTSGVIRVSSLVFGFLLIVGAIGTATMFEFSSAAAEVEYAAKDEVSERVGPNVILVTIDTLRADHLGCYGYGRPTSPFIDTLAMEGARFADASSPAAWTKPSTGTILTGLFPSRHGALYHGSTLQIPEGERTLAEAFRDRGYTTAGFVSNPNVKKVFDFDRGFDEFFDSPVEDTITLAAIRKSLFGGIVMTLSRHQFNWKYENDIKQINQHVLAWIEANREQPFFLYVHYIDPHIPYTPPAKYEAEFKQNHPGFPLFNERKRLVGIDLYDGEIRYTDDGIRELVEKLDQLGVRDHTLLVLTSDHGEEFFEHDVLGHGFSLYQPVIHVPLIANGPGVAKGRVVDSPVQLVDLAATILDLTGGAGDKFGDGYSFAPSISDSAWKAEDRVYLENEFGQDDSDHRSFVLNAYRDGDWKFILTERSLYRPPNHPDFGAQELYNLADDPGETNNLIHAPEHQERIEAMVKRLREHSVFLNDSGFRDIEPAALSPEMEEEMRALGYLGDD